MYLHLYLWSFAAKMIPLFMLFAGGPLGSGKQWYCTHAVFHISSVCDNYLVPRTISIYILRCKNLLDFAIKEKIFSKCYQTVTALSMGFNFRYISLLNRPKCLMRLLRLWPCIYFLHNFKYLTVLIVLQVFLDSSGWHSKPNIWSSIQSIL